MTSAKAEEEKLRAHTLRYDTSFSWWEAFVVVEDGAKSVWFGACGEMSALLLESARKRKG
ncbi:hypothetical protein CCP2SC5_380028 [Azospirillaceae bacterium]